MTIKNAREKSGLTQALLAEKIGVSQQSVARWETGGRKPKYDTLTKIAAACGVEVACLLPGHGAKLRKAEQMSGFGCYPQTCTDIFSRISDMLSDTCTAGQLAEIAKAINAAFQSGKSSTGAEMIDDNCVWINKLQKAIDISAVK